MTADLDPALEKWLDKRLSGIDRPINFSLYVYAYHNPAGYRDPHGKQSIPVTSTLLDQMMAKHYPNISKQQDSGLYYETRGRMFESAVLRSLLGADTPDTTPHPSPWRGRNVVPDIVSTTKFLRQSFNPFAYPEVVEGRYFGEVKATDKPTLYTGDFDSQIGGIIDAAGQGSKTLNNVEFFTNAKLLFGRDIRDLANTRNVVVYQRLSEYDPQTGMMRVRGSSGSYIINPEMLMKATRELRLMVAPDLVTPGRWVPFQ